MYTHYICFASCMVIFLGIVLLFVNLEMSHLHVPNSILNTLLIGLLSFFRFQWRLFVYDRFFSMSLLHYIFILFYLSLSMCYNIFIESSQVI